MDDSQHSKKSGSNDCTPRSSVSLTSTSPSTSHNHNAPSQSNPSALEKSQTAQSGMDSSIPFWRRCLIVFVLSWCCLGATFSSTSLLSVDVEIAKELDSSTEAVNLSTAGLVLVSGFGSFIWSPITSIFGRRLAYLLCIACLFFFTMGAALARDMPTFIVMRILSGCSGTFFHVCGQTILAEYFPPTQRGTATGFFLSGSVLGPPLGPCIAGIITNFTSWRVLLWLQCVMIGIGFILSACIVPPAKADRGFGLINMPLRKGLAQFNPLPVFKLMKYPNIGFSHLSCGFLSFSQYFLLAAPRQILANEFHMTSPLASGLFYIAPAAGFLLGTVVGGRLSDYTVRSWIIERGGLRLPQDRLNGGIPWLFLVIPPASLIYGWGMELGNLSHHSGGLAFPIVFVFVIAFGQLAAFACLNTYCAEALPRKRREVIAGKYAVQYAFGACACAGAGPLIKVIGVGSACTIAAILVLISTVLVWATAKYGLKMQMWAEREQESLPHLSQSQNGKNRQDEHLS